MLILSGPTYTISLSSVTVESVRPQNYSHPFEVGLLDCKISVPKQSQGIFIGPISGRNLEELACFFDANFIINLIILLFGLGIQPMQTYILYFPSSANKQEKSTRFLFLVVYFSELEQNNNSSTYYVCFQYILY